MLTWQCRWVVEWLVVVSFNAVWHAYCTHKHLYSQGQLTIVHLFWTDVLSGSTAQVSALSFMQETAPFLFPPQVVLSPSAGPRASFQSTVGGHYLFCLTILCRAPSPWTRGKRPSPCGSFFPHSKCSETVMMVMIVMMTAVPLFMVSTHRLSGLHCSATFIKKSVSQEYLWLWIIRES